MNAGLETFDMRHSAVRLFDYSIIALALCATAGCFNEPEPAYKTVPGERRVYLSEKGLKAVPPVCAEADYLNLDYNQLEKADGVEKLVNLKWLRLNGNRLSTLPDLSALVNLRRIYLKGNRFTAVPETLKGLPALTDVDLSGNPITEIPTWLAEKKGLQNLSFSGTRISALPQDLTAWRSLVSLQLGGLNLPAAEMARIRAALPHTAVVF